MIELSIEFLAKAGLLTSSLLPAGTLQHHWTLLQYTHTHLPDTYLAA